MKDTFHETKVVATLVPAVQAATLKGDAVDLQGFGSALLAINTGAIVGAGAFDLKVQEANTKTDADFTDVAADDLLGTLPGKQKVYVRIITWKLIARSGNELNVVRLLLRKQRIFMQKDMTEKFDAGIEMMTRAFVGKKLQFQDPQNFKGAFAIAYLDGHIKLFEDVANAANERLFRDEKNEQRSQ